MQGDLQMTASIVVVGDVAACWPLEPWPKALMEVSLISLLAIVLSFEEFCKHDGVSM